MTTPGAPPRYRSYLLAFWEERGREPRREHVWRFSLLDPHTGERRGFASLEALVTALAQEIESTTALQAEEGGVQDNLVRPSDSRQTTKV
jgi:hypothetical protein